MTEKLYAERSICGLWPHYTKHVSAMTGEALHDKGAIAAELAWRDAEIERNREAIAELIEVLNEARAVIRFYKPETFGCGTGNRIDKAITKHDTQPTKKGSN